MNETIYFIEAPPIKGRVENKMSRHIFDNLKNKNKFWIKGLEEEVIPTSFNFYDTQVWIKHQILVIQNLQNTPLKNGDTLFFSDFWFPGLDLIKLYIESINIKIYFSSFCHGASFVEGDLMSSKWCASVEKAWLDIYDSVLIQTEYTRKTLTNKEHSEKCVVVGSPFDASKFPTTENKEFDIVWPHRLSEDKGLTEFKNLLPLLKKYKVMVTIPVPKLIPDSQVVCELKELGVTVIYDSRDAAHVRNISNAKCVLSTAKQETWGYAVMEAVSCGAVPVLPNRACYPYLYSSHFRYNTDQECVDIIEKVVDGHIKAPKINSCTICGYFYKGLFLCVQ